MTSLSVDSNENSTLPEPRSTTETDLELHEACITADETELERLLISGTNPNRMVGPLAECDYPLNTAARTGSLPLVRVLLRHHVYMQMGAISEAADRGDKEMLELLLEPLKAYWAANPASRRWRDDVARILSTAIKNGQGRIVKSLWVFQPRLEHFEELVEAGLIAASGNDDLTSVTAFVDMGAGHIDAALKAAAEHKHLSIMQHLLTTHNLRPEQLIDSLVAAAASGYIPSIDLLRIHGAIDPGYALIAAAEFNKTSMLENLLQVFPYSPQMLSKALSLTAASGDLNSIQVLIGAGAEDIDALRLAAENGNTSAMRLLLVMFEHSEKALADAFAAILPSWVCDATRRNDLQASILTETYEPVSLLLEKGAKLSSKKYCQLLEYLILQESFHMIRYVEYLLQNRSKFTYMDQLPDDYLVSLMIYHWPSRNSIIQMLIDLPVRRKATLQSYEEQSGDDSSIQAVHQPTISHENSDPSSDSNAKVIPTTLLAAVLTKRETLCKDLLARSTSDINTYCYYTPTKHPTSYYARSPFGEHRTLAPSQHIFGTTRIRDNPLSAAVRAKHFRVIELLVSHGADPWLNDANLSIFSVSGLGLRSLFRPLVALARATDLFHTDRQEIHGGRTILHWAAYFDDYDLVSEFIRHGADINVLDWELHSPLHMAVFTASVESTKRLCFAGADTNLRDAGRPQPISMPHQEGETALEWAERRSVGIVPGSPSREQYRDIVKFLKQWRNNGLGRLDQAEIKQDYERDARDKDDPERAMPGGRDKMEDNIAWFSDEESVHFSDEDGDSNTVEDK